MNGYCVGARERFISLSAINISFTFYIDVDGRDCRPLNIDYIIHEILYASAYVQVQTLNYIGLFILSGRLLQISRCDLAPNSNVSFSPTSDCAKSFFPLFFAYSIR